ncbi:Stf0 family sulfotransferase [Roseibium sp.]|uniref:Stf0 family sulfotransferase n=1 Tax=Roseibium sp. TaxID=1936156 RepID=UPI003D0F9B6A
MTKYNSYIICTSPRSGSTLLCKLLGATGISGNPGSHFHEPSLQAWLEYYGLDNGEAEQERETLERIFQAAMEKGSRNTGIFGLRLQRHSFDFFMEKLGLLHPDVSSDPERLEAVFGRTLFIHLTRPDKLAQAVSYVKAEQTGLWHRAPDGTELERLAPPAEPVYDEGEIRATCERFTAFDRDWQTWFEVQGIEPFRITYDDLSADPQGLLRDVLEALGLDGTVAGSVTPGVARLADATNEAWVKRFRQEEVLPVSCQLPRYVE